MSRLVGTAPLPSPPVISPASRSSGVVAAVGQGLTVSASGASPWSDAANCLLACPFFLEAQTTFYKGFWVNGATGSGANVEVGIWDDSYNKIITTGSIAQSASTSVPQVNAFTATVTLPPGRYYMGMAASATTTALFFRWSANRASFWQMAGCWRQSGVTLGSLAATATPGDMSNVAFPHFGLITRSVFDV